MTLYQGAEDEKSAANAGGRQDVKKRIQPLFQTMLGCGLRFSTDGNAMVPIFDIDAESMCHDGLVPSATQPNDGTTLTSCSPRRPIKDRTSPSVHRCSIGAENLSNSSLYNTPNE